MLLVPVLRLPGRVGFIFLLWELTLVIGRRRRFLSWDLYRLTLRHSLGPWLFLYLSLHLDLC